MRILVIIPTYNERENLPKIIRKIQNLGIKNLDILIIDDNSPDGTGKLADEYSHKFKNIFVIHREKKMGLGTAYKTGFKYAIEKGYDYVFEMDADLSHDPDDIPRFLKEIRRVDLVIGSRYCKGGKVVNWPSSRRLLSFLANLYAKILTGVPINDMTSGYKCYRRKVIENYDYDKLRAEGYGFQIETVFYAFKKGFKLKEIPIIFHDRVEGKSKLGRKIVYEAFFRVLSLCLHDRRWLVR